MCNPTNNSDVEDRGQTLQNLAAYFQQLEHFKIRNVVTINSNASNPGFKIVKIADLPKTEVLRLP